eukprot:8018696-Ditylum_brightwellii.AAC.1
MILSHPRLGKHLLFDGRLLHGAPGHLSLREEKQEGGQQKCTQINNDDEEEEDKDDIYNNIRITFLVNIWSNQCKPSGVHTLSSQIRNKIKSKSSNPSLPSSLRNKESEKRNAHCLSFVPKPITHVSLQDIKANASLNKNDDCEEDENGQIVLPFVSKGATWIDDDGDDDNGLILRTFVPPRKRRDPKIGVDATIISDDDTLHVEFGEGMEAYLDRLNNEHEDGEDKDESDFEGNDDGNNDWKMD